MKRYQIGMYGGKFLPFHKGHRYCVDIAAQECEQVYVILFWGGADEEEIMRTRSEVWLSVGERVRQMEEICARACRYAQVISVQIDIRALRLPDGSEDWDAETPLVRQVVGPRLDAVYSSEEHYGAYFKRAYPEAVHRLVDVRRLHHPISGTRIREMEREDERNLWII